MSSDTERSFEGVRAVALANVYFNGGVVSHTIHFPDGTRKTLGVVFPGTYEFGTSVPERLEITAGECEVTLPGSEPRRYGPGSAFDVPRGVTFRISAGTLAQYVCSYF